MHATRRQLLEAGALVAAAGLLPRSALARARPRAKPLALLVLGGTKFLGPELVASARARGHAVTLFNRGKTNPGLFPELETLHGDRKDDLKSLEGRSFDAVLDTSGYFPGDVARSAGLLAERVARYLFVSTVSVYGGDAGTKALDEDSPVARLSPEASAAAERERRIDAESYGPLKALCEEAAEAAMPGRVAVVRPGLIVGPGDPSDRWTYWPWRVARGGELLAPEGPGQELQFLDVRDLADFCVHLLEEQRAGTWIADGPAQPLPLGRLLEESRRQTRSDARVTWVPWSFLAAQGVAPWSDLPVWLPAPAGRESRFAWSNARAQRDGLRFRALADTIRDTLAWFEKERGADATPKAGLAREREAAVLAAWRARGESR